MSDSGFLHIEFLGLILTSVLIPCAIYLFLLLTKSVSRWTVLGLAVVLIALSAVDVILLQHLAEIAKPTPSRLDNLFSEEISLALYLLPAVFAGIGVNLVSHILISHLKDAERGLNKRLSSKEFSSVCPASLTN